MGRRLLLGDATLVDEALHEGVVAGEADQLAVAEHVGAGIADVGDADAGAVDQERHDRRAGTAQLRVVLGERGELRSGIVERLAESSGQIDVREVGQVGGELLSSSMTAPTATVLATSPWACPPMPSATTSRRVPAAAESWFIARLRPTSDPAADSSVGDMGSPLSSCGDSPGDPLSATREPTAFGPLVTSCHAHRASMAAQPRRDGTLHGPLRSRSDGLAGPFRPP